MTCLVTYLCTYKRVHTHPVPKLSLLCFVYLTKSVSANLINNIRTCKYIYIYSHMYMLKYIYEIQTNLLNFLCLFCMFELWQRVHVHIVVCWYMYMWVYFLINILNMNYVRHEICLPCLCVFMFLILLLLLLLPRLFFILMCHLGPCTKRHMYIYACLYLHVYVKIFMGQSPIKMVKYCIFQQSFFCRNMYVVWDKKTKI